MTQTATTPIFSAENVDVAYGAIKAVRSASLTLMTGEVVALLGANGAGKSSMLNAAMGLAPRVSGTFTFKGQDISSTPTEQIAKLGLTLVFEGRRVFPKLSVSENMFVLVSGVPIRSCFLRALELYWVQRLPGRSNL